MDKQKALLLGLLAALVVVLFVLSVAIGSGGGEADPDNSGGVGALDGLLAGLPGLGNDLDADDVDIDCFDEDRFVLDRDDGPTSCRLRIGDDIDRVALDFVVAGCSIEVTGQDGSVDHTVDADDADEDGELRIGLTGSGADLRFDLDFGAQRCIVALR